MVVDGPGDVALSLREVSARDRILADRTDPGRLLRIRRVTAIRYNREPLGDVRPWFATAVAPGIVHFGKDTVRVRSK